MTIATLTAAIEAKKLEIQAKEREIRNFAYEATQEEYDDFLREVYGDEVEICGGTYAPGYALRLVDEVAYNTGKSDYEDSKDLDDVEEYTDLQSELEDLESELEDLENELEEAEEEENEENN